jgi:methylated-DNA-[protein]-cysteine S-methyltransferase
MAKHPSGAAESYWLFDTGIGFCGVAWSAHGLTRLQLPESDRARTEDRLRERTHAAQPTDPPQAIAGAILEIELYLLGTRPDFTTAPLDLSAVPPFDRAVYDLAQRVNWGQVTTYGEIAKALGEPGAARAVGAALGRNPIPIINPCHRVVGSDGKAVGFSAFGGTLTKESLLYLEGIRIDGAPLLPGMEPRPRRR